MVSFVVENEALDVFSQLAQDDNPETRMPLMEDRCEASRMFVSL